MSYQHQLPAVPENSVVATWQQPAPLPQQAAHPSCFVSRLAGELLLSRNDNMNLRHMSTQLQKDVGCWRQEYDRLLVEHWKVLEQNTSLLGQVSRLKEQIRVTRPKRTNNRARRDERMVPAVVETGISDNDPTNDQVAGGDRH